MEKTPPASTSLEQMAEEIFALTVMGWRQRLSKAHTTELSESQYLTIETLVNARGTLTVGEIQRAIGVLPAQMSRIIRALESSSGSNAFDKPLIRCELNQSDKRKIDVHLLPEGRRIFDEFRMAYLTKTVDVLKNLADKDRTEFVRICRRIREVVNTPAPS